jgi:class 3 adenylate cyclase/CheY-like chemotaxis protein
VNPTLKHELRTPLNHIVGYCELLLEEAGDRGGERFAPGLQRMHAAGKRMLSVVNDLFDPDRDALSHPLGGVTLDDLRAPLGEILGDAGVLQKDAVASARADVLADLGKIAVAARELLALVEEHVPQKGDDSDLYPGGSRRVTTFLRPEAPAATSSSSQPGALLVVDDNAGNRDMLSRRLIRLGHHVTTAVNGREAIDTLHRDAFDLMLLDIQMPEMDGYQVLDVLKADPVLRRVPVIVLSAADDSEGIARCIQMGAEDYLPKPFDPVLLQARLTACLEKKRLRDREQLHLRQIRSEQQKSERLLLNILPGPIADRLKEGEQGIVDSFPDATVLFGDLVGFTSLAAAMSPAQVVEMLNGIFSAFDQAVAELGLEKIKTIGDSYMAVGGVPVQRRDHVAAVADLALRMQQEMRQFNASAGTSIQVRIGMHVGPVVAGIIGRHKFAYDLWGDTVNVASRMESHSSPGRIQVTAAVEERLRGRYRFAPRGPIELKSIGWMPTFFLLGPA